MNIYFLTLQLKAKLLIQEVSRIQGFDKLKHGIQVPCLLEGCVRFVCSPAMLGNRIGHPAQTDSDDEPQEAIPQGFNPITEAFHLTAPAASAGRRGGGKSGPSPSG